MNKHVGMSQNATPAPATRNEATRRFPPKVTISHGHMVLTRTVANVRTVVKAKATSSEHTANAQTPRVKPEPEENKHDYHYHQSPMIIHIFKRTSRWILSSLIQVAIAILGLFRPFGRSSWKNDMMFGMFTLLLSQSFRHIQLTLGFSAGSNRWRTIQSRLPWNPLWWPPTRCTQCPDAIHSEFGHHLPSTS